jgi:hypothetical protein
VQEIVLLRAVGAELPDAKHAAFARLSAAWQAHRTQQFDAAMDALAQPIAKAACDRATIAGEGFRDRLRDLGKSIGIGRDAGESAQERAMLVLAERLDADLRSSTDTLIGIYGLEGRAAGDVLARLAKSVTTEVPVSEGKAAALGGFLSGALSGLAVDLAHGGLTMGAGMLAGGLLGALGGAGIARGYNVAKGREETSVRWSEEFLDGLVPAALLRYLAVAHYGRGRGEWTETECPDFWPEVVANGVARHRGALAAAWRDRESRDEAAVAAPLRATMGAIALDVLAELYPGALPPAPPPGPA